MTEKPSIPIRTLRGIAGSLFLRFPFWFIAWWTLPTLCNWDCGIYSNISRHYAAADSAFFPLFPLLVHAAGLILPFLSPDGAVVFVSNLFVPIAGTLFLFLADELWSASGAPTGAPRLWGFYRRSWLALLLLSVFPEGHFWMRGYSEPLFFALLMGILLALFHRRWLWVGACCGLIAVTRPQGVWVAAIVGGYLVWKLVREWRLREQCRALLTSVVFCGIPFLGFLVWLWARTGNPLYFWAAQHNWGRAFDFLGGLKDQLPRWDASHFYLYLSLWAAFRFMRRPLAEWRLVGILSLVLSELPVFFGGFFSYVRFASVNPAMFLLVSELISDAGWGSTGLSVPITFAVVIWSIVRLAIQVHMAGSTWVG